MRITEMWNLPEAIARRLGSGTGRQRAIVEEGHLLLVLHRLPEASEPERTGEFFWRQPDGSWESTGRGGGLGLLRKHIESYDAAVNDLEEEYDDAETSEECFEILEAMAPIRRAAKNLAAAMQTARERISLDREIIDLRDRSYDISRAADLLYTDTKNRLDRILAEKAEIEASQSLRMTEIGHRLNVLAALFLPLTAITSVFGMNLHSGIEAVPGLFWYVFGVGTALGLVMIGMLRRSERA